MADNSAPSSLSTATASPSITPEMREYMAIGVIDDEEVGLDSDIVSVLFGG